MKYSVATLLAVSGFALAAPVPEPTGIPSESSARTQLAGLTVAASTNTGTYDRDLFPHWITISGACNTRETVLKRDGSGVVTNSACSATSGTWYSPYDGATWTAASDVDIDHMVPLYNAWVSGAASWTTAKRQSFANDLVRPQLWAVTDNVNQEKSSSAPDAWKPPLTSFYCKYARSWIAVKSYWALTVTSAEKAALADMLDYC
ncbi:bacterial-type extracellular deoxyribonuclease [Thelonectria olida]|uniref:Bacterial-type extracellular deoxyribonuclease n=1 Tax=Thelonectria olida TaxID=1576542 RepID=A0A9P8WI94_9HYPO|nr:bacterial-type extracellular deoxyribonuclease [Thelonectria olida]